MSFRRVTHCADAIQHQALDPSACGVEVRELLQGGPEGGLLGEPTPLVDLCGVRGVERDPEEDEPSVLVAPAGQLLRPMEPTQRYITRNVKRQTRRGTES